MLLGLTSDPDALVRDAAVHALGVYILFPCQRSDVSFVADAANVIITCTEDEVPNVRIRASWSIANVAEALLLNM